LSEYSDPHLKEIVDKLDDLFLYLSTVPTILFTVIQVALGEEMLIYFLPILIPTFVALYIGYIRGAITVNTLGERFRGWMYLIAAILLYPAYYCIIYLRIRSLVISCIGLLYGIIAYIIADRIIPFFTNLARRMGTKITFFIRGCTLSASLSLAIASQLLSLLIFDYLHNGSAKYTILFFTMFFGISFIINELLARRELQSLSNSKRKS